MWYVFVIMSLCVRKFGTIFFVLSLRNVIMSELLCGSSTKSNRPAYCKTERSSGRAEAQSEREEQDCSAAPRAHAHFGLLAGSALILGSSAQKK